MKIVVNSACVAAAALTLVAVLGAYANTHTIKQMGVPPEDWAVVMFASCVCALTIIHKRGGIEPFTFLAVVFICLPAFFLLIYILPPFSVMVGIAILMGELDPGTFNFQPIFGVLTILAMLGSVAAMDTRD